MTPTSTSRLAPGMADNLGALRLIVVVALALDAASTFSYLTGDAGGVATDVLTTLQLVLVPVAAAVTMWLRPRVALVLCTVVLGLALVNRPTSEELWLLLVVSVVVGARAQVRTVALVAVGQLAYTALFGLRVERRYPGEGVGAAAVVLAFCAAGYLAGVVVRRLLHVGARRRQRLVEIEQENLQIRDTERRRLADDLQTVVTGGLRTIRAQLVRAHEGAGDAAQLRRRLERIDHESRSVLTELRALLEVLRRDAPTAPPDPAVPEPRRFLAVLTARQVRLAAAAAAILLGARAVAGWDGTLLDARLLVQVLGWVAVAAAVWRPRVGGLLAAVALVVSLAAGTPTDWDALPTGVLFFVAALRARVRRSWIVVLALVTYLVLLAVSSPDWVDRVLVAGYAGAVAVVGGLAAGHFVEVERASARHQAGLLDDRGRLEAEERNAVARELHDVVAHQLSLTALLIMATSASDDPEVLVGTLRRVEECVETTDHELLALLRTMRGTATDEVHPTPLVLPSAGADTFARRLAASGFRPEVTADPGADDLDATTQRTLGRIMQEATTNIVRYAPAGSRCAYALVVTQDRVRLTVASPLPVQDRASAFSLGWGLRGIAERVELSHGSFDAGPRRGEWFVDVTLPRTTDREALPAAGLAR